MDADPSGRVAPIERSSVMHRNPLRLAQLLVCGFLLGLAGAALAVDGVIEINHTSALVTGYPVNLTATGSYRLTGNLTPPAGVPAILVTAPNVEIDLNGFSILGGGGAGVPGIDSVVPVTGLTVRNGAIRGFSGPGVRLCPEARLLHVHISNNGGGGVAGARSCLIEDSVIFANNGAVAVEAFACKIENNVIEQNAGGPGILGDDNVIVHNRIANTLGQTGVLSPGGRSLIAENTISGNGLDGIECGPSCTIKGNTVMNNGDAGVVAIAPGSNVVGNSISFNATFGLQIGPQSSFSNNNISNNTVADKVPAAHFADPFDNLCGGGAC
jgi:hypothetical protein